jgi:hypothetical protein
LRHVISAGIFKQKKQRQVVEENLGGRRRAADYGFLDAVSEHQGQVGGGRQRAARERAKKEKARISRQKNLNQEYHEK